MTRCKAHECRTNDLIQMSATPQMLVYHLALREPQKRINTALQPLTRGLPILCGLRLVLMRFYGSEYNS